MKRTKRAQIYEGRTRDQTYRDGWLTPGTSENDSVEITIWCRYIASDAQLFQSIIYPFQIPPPPPPPQGAGGGLCENKQINL
jgi:hypothetical protein